MASIDYISYFDIRIFVIERSKTAYNLFSKKVPTIAPTINPALYFYKQKVENRYIK